MRKSKHLEELWNLPSCNSAARRRETLPEPAQRYLEHAIAPGLEQAYAVRLSMHGEIRLRGWYPFRAEQVIHWDRGMIWHAAIRIHGIPVSGSDSFLAGAGASRWKALGLMPLANAGGADVTRSAAGRMNIESIWLPSVLCGADVSWNSTDTAHARASFIAHNEKASIDYEIGRAGELRSVSMPRWGNPGTKRFELIPCGGTIEEERTFEGFTVPSRVRVGWHFGSPRFEAEGEFFRATIDNAVYRRYSTASTPR